MRDFRELRVWEKAHELDLSCLPNDYVISKDRALWPHESNAKM